MDEGWGLSLMLGVSTLSSSSVSWSLPSLFAAAAGVSSASASAADPTA